MNKTNWYPGLRIGSKFMATALQLSSDEIQDFVKSITSKYGLVVDTLASGSYSNDFTMHIFQGALLLNGGYFISDFNDIVNICNVETTVVPGNPANLPSGTYNIYIKPKQTNYEKGYLTFTQGSDLVTITDGSFDKLQPLDRIKIQDSTLNNNGTYTVTGNITSNIIQVSEAITGQTEANLKWKILGYFGSNYISELNGTEYLYEYNDFDLLLSLTTVENAFMLGTVDVANSHFTNLTDKRSENIYTLKAIASVNADNVIQGVTNAITTIEEKKLAQNIPTYFNKILTNGILNGLAGSILNSTLSFTEGYAIDYLGRLIYVPAQTINLNTLLSQNYITEGNNYIYLTYKSPNLYQILYSKTYSESPNVIMLGNVMYRSDVLPYFIYEKTLLNSKGTFSSIVLSAKGNNSKAGEIYYLPVSNGNGQVHYIRLASDGDTLEDIRICNYDEMTNQIDSLNTSLRTYIDAGDRALSETIGNVQSTLISNINTVASNLTTLSNHVDNLRIYEKIRFSKYPDDSGTNENYLGWFTVGELPAPTIIGKDFKIISMTVAQLPIINRPDHGTLGSYIENRNGGGSYPGGVTVAKDAYAMSNKIQTIDLSASETVYNANSLLGIYFDGSAKKIELIVTGSTGTTSVTYANLGYTSQMPSVGIYIAEVVISYAQ